MDEGLHDEAMDISLILRQAVARKQWKSQAVANSIQQSAVLARWKGGTSPSDGKITVVT